MSLVDIKKKGNEMNNRHNQQCLEVWGDYAFFGNSIYGANRRSYEFPTPAAVIGIFESIYWKPCFRWVPDEIQILSPIQYMTLMRNELRSRACDMMGSTDLANLLSGWSDVKKNLATKVKAKLSKDVFITDGEVKGRKKEKYVDEDVLREYVYHEVDSSDLRSYYIGMTNRYEGKNERVQRCDKVLKDVRYRFIAHIEYDPSKETEPGGSYYKHVNIFTRRAQRGQCFCQPFLGCREFPAFFRWVDMDDPKSRLSSEELKKYTPTYRGLMHYGFKWDDSSKKPIPLDYRPYISGGRVFISSATCQEYVASDEYVEDSEHIEPSEGKDVYVAKVRDAVKPKKTEKKEGK